MSKCDECGAHITIPKDCVVGEIVDCPACGTGYEVKKVKGKLELWSLYMEGEDWGE